MVIQIEKDGKITAIGRGRDLTKLERRCFEAAWTIFFVGLGISFLSMVMVL